MYKETFLKKILSILVIAVFYFPQLAFAFTIVSPPENVSVSASVGPVIVVSPLDDNGGGSSGFLTVVNFSGLAYPGATVHIWKDGTPLTTKLADQNGEFSIDLNEPYSNGAMYTLYAIDKEFRKSLLLNYPIAITNGYYTQIKGVRFPPTISTDKAEVKYGDNITISGYALPNMSVDIAIEGTINKTFSEVIPQDGKYKFTYKLDSFPRGDYTVKINYKNDKRSSKIIKFIVGDVNILSTESINNIPGDCNADQIINLIDFSVLAFWYKKESPPACVDTNHDNIIDLVDFSILAFYWTG